MSATKSIGLGEEFIWAYDATVSLLLAQVIRDVAGLPADRQPGWWPTFERKLRVQAVITEFALQLESDLADEEREELAQLIEAAAGRLMERRVFTREEAAEWKVLDDTPVIFRGTEPTETAVVADLSEAMVGLIRGTLPTPPPGTRWFVGNQGGRRTIRMRDPAGD